MSAGNLTIGALARQTNTKVETIRFYEKNGLLPAPPRTESNYRTYDLSHLNRLCRTALNWVLPHFVWLTDR